MMVHNVYGGESPSVEYTDLAIDKGAPALPVTRRDRALGVLAELGAEVLVGGVYLFATVLARYLRTNLLMIGAGQITEAASVLAAIAMTRSMSQVRASAGRVYQWLAFGSMTTLILSVSVGTSQQVQANKSGVMGGTWSWIISFSFLGIAGVLLAIIAIDAVAASVRPIELQAGGKMETCNAAALAMADDCAGDARLRKRAVQESEMSTHPFMYMVVGALLGILISGLWKRSVAD